MSGENERDVLQACAECGSQLASETMYPVVAGTDDDGDAVLRAFCDDACQSSWEARD